MGHALNVSLSRHRLLCLYCLAPACLSLVHHLAEAAQLLRLQCRPTSSAPSVATRVVQDRVDDLALNAEQEYVWAWWDAVATGVVLRARAAHAASLRHRGHPSLGVSPDGVLKYAMEVLSGRARGKSGSFFLRRRSYSMSAGCP